MAEQIYVLKEIGAYISFDVRKLKVLTFWIDLCCKKPYQYFLFTKALKL